MKKQSDQNSIYLDVPLYPTRFVNIEGLKNALAEIDVLNSVVNTYPAHHCYLCGDCAPKHGFYPMVAIGIFGSTSSLLCNRCARTDEDYYAIFKEQKEVLLMKRTEKYLATFRFRTKSADGCPAKIVCQLYDNGSVEIKQFFLSDHKQEGDPSLACSKFKKHLYIRYIFFKFTTLQTILNCATTGLVKNKVPVENII